MADDVLDAVVRLMRRNRAQQTTEGSTEADVQPGSDSEPCKRACATKGTDMRPPADAGVAPRPSPHIGYVPLHNGVPQWKYAMETQSLAEVQLNVGFTGPVVECIVRKPMTREEAQEIARSHSPGLDFSWRNEWIVGAILEAANGRADGGEG